MKLFVIIVTYNGMQWYDRCFGSLRNSTIPSHIVVIDNLSLDNTVNYIKDNYPDIHLIENSSNMGFGKANNIGIEYAIDNYCDYVYLLNQDAWVETHTFEVLVNLSKKYPEYGIISPIHINSKNDMLDTNFQRYISESKYISDLILSKNSSDIYECEFTNAAHWLITRKCLDIVGLFSSVFPHYGEDANYTHRAIYHNFKIGFSPLSKCVHAREERAVSNKKLFYMNYIEFLVRSCNINTKQNYIYNSFLFWIKSFLYFIKYHNILALKYSTKPFTAFLSIMKNNRISRLVISRNDKAK